MRMISYRCSFAERVRIRATVAYGRIGTGAVLMLALSGCLSTSLNEPNYLHKPAEFTIAKQAKEKLEKIDYFASINQEREVQARILERELAVVDAFATSRRNFELLNLAGTDGVKSHDLKQKIGAREDLLFGASKPALTGISIADMTEPAAAQCGAGLIDPAAEEHATVKAWIEAQQGSLDSCRTELADQIDSYEGSLHFSPPPCPSNGEIRLFDKLKPKEAAALVEEYKKAFPTRNWSDVQIKALIKPTHNSYAEKCLVVRSHERAVAAMMGGCEEKGCGPRAPAGARVTGIGGKLAEASKRLNSAVTALRQDKAAAETAAANYKTAEAAYKAAAKKHADGPSDATKKELENKGKEVKDALDKLGKAGGFIGVDLLSEEQIAGIDTILKSISAGTYDTDALAAACKADGEKCAIAQASAVAASLPGFIDRAKFIRSLSEAPPLSGLILEKARLLALQENAKKAIDRRNREIKLLKSIADAYVAEGATLLRASQLLTSSEEKQKDGDKVQADAWNLRAVAAYLQTFTKQRRTVHAAEYHLAALQHEAAVDYSETSLKIWKSAIETPVAALYAYHEGGLKPEDIVELLKALGLGGIAVGVN